MKKTNPFITIESTTNAECGVALLHQIRNAIESMRCDWSEFTNQPIQAAVDYLASEHGLSCHLLCWLRLWHQTESAGNQMEVLRAFILLLRNAIGGKIPDPEAHRKAATFLLASENDIDEVALFFRVFASDKLKDIDPRYLAQWNSDTSARISVDRSIWTVANEGKDPQSLLIEHLQMRGNGGHANACAETKNCAAPAPSPTPPTRATPAAAPGNSPDPVCVLSKSQEEVFATLEGMLGVFATGGRSLAGVTPRFHPLLVGPSSSGKTFLVSELARRHKLPLLSLNVGSWVVSGGHRPTTIQSLAGFVERNDRGVIILDEADKINGASDWMRYVQQEVFALLDGRLGDFPDFSHVLNSKLQTGFFLVGAGTWQDLQPPLLRHGAYGEPPFGPLRIPMPRLRANLEGQKSIRDELLLRFNAQVLHIEPMEREEIRQRVLQICKAGGFQSLSQGQIDGLVAEVIASRAPQRALESLVTRILAHRAKS